MRCAWDKLMAILPEHIRKRTEPFQSKMLQQIHLRTGRPVVLDTLTGPYELDAVAAIDDLKFVVNAASRYSPWAAESADHGYITAPGGHRIGLGGQCVVRGGVLTGIRHVHSLCIRVARDVCEIAPRLSERSGSVLIIGPPGSGKTTMLRDMIREISNRNAGGVVVVDERGEIFPPSCGFDTGINTDVLLYAPKPQGIMMALRTMGASWIALDEITEQIDCAALRQAFFCGVRFLATAHAADISDLRRRELYRNLMDSGVFETVLTMRLDKTYTVERMTVCN